MIDVMVKIVACLSALAIIARTFPLIVRRMDATTAFLIRAAVHFLAVGALGELWSVLIYGNVPSLPHVILMVGVVSLMLCERRMRAISGPYHRHAQGGRST